MLRSLLVLKPFCVVPSLVLLALLAGCGRTETTPLSVEDLSSRALTYNLEDIDSLEAPDAAGSHRFTVTLARAPEGCTRLVDGVTATFNGQSMKLEPGGVSSSGGREVCDETRAWIDFDPEVWDAEPVEDARVFFQAPDGSRALSLIVKGAKAKRHFAYQGPGSGGTLRQGQTYLYLWTPVEETPEPATATLLREGGRAPATLQLVQDKGRVSLTLPASTPVANHLLTLSSSLQAEVLECQGVASCQGAIFHSSDFAVAVAP